MATRQLSTKQVVNLASDPATGTPGELYYNTTSNIFKYYNGTTWAEIVGGAEGASLTVSETAPEPAESGDLWLNSATLKLLVYYDSFWVEIGGGGGGGGLQNVVEDTTPELGGNLDASSFNITNIDNLSFDTIPDNPGGVGALVWDDGEGTLKLGLKGGEVSLQLGQENIALCYNGTGSTITNGSVVYISGAQGQRPSISLADADSEPTSSKTFGIAVEDIANGAEGFVATFGVVPGLNTSGFTAGQALWLSSTAGQLTNVKPSAPTHAVFVGYCLSANPSSGRIFVNPQNGYEINELHDISISSLADNHILSYDNATSLWKNQGLAAAIQEVDGPSSGIDADLLDGQHGSHYLDWTNTTNKPDPTITLAGDLSGSVTLTDLGNGTLTATVADDSHNHIISNVDGLQTALDNKAPLASPALSGTPTAPTAASGTNTTQIATTAFVQSATAALVDSAPTTLDTLNELAAALGDDPNFATTVSTALGNKQPLDADLTAIAALAGTSGFLKKTAADTWTLDTTTYQPSSTALTTSTSFGGNVSGTYNAIVVANDSHTHQFNNLTNKTSGTGEYSTDSNLTSGRGSGGVSLTINDGYGNANVTWNHKAGVPEQNGNAGRIIVNTDATSGATMEFQLKSNVTGGSAVSLTNVLTLTETSALVQGGTVWHSANDGAGSGLDADLLDGQQGSYYATDSAVVHLAGTETITGAKTFSATTTFSGNVNINGVLDLTNTGVISALDMSNNSIVGVNTFSFADPGAQEGITWSGGNGWWIYESPDNLTNAAGNLQIVQNSTRRATFKTDGSFEVLGNIFSTVSDASPLLLLKNTTTVSTARYPQIQLINYSNTGIGFSALELKASRGSESSPTAVQANDILGTLAGWGYDGTSFNDIARIYFYAENNLSSSDARGAIAFHTQEGTTLSEKMRIRANGNVGIGISAPAYKLDVSGGIRSTGEIISTNANQFRMVNGNYGAFFRQDGASTYLLFTNSGDQYGSWNSLRPFAINNASGLVVMANSAEIRGTSSSSVPLTVKGVSGQSNNLQNWADSSSNILASISNTGVFTAISKSFDIEHPTKENMRLRYGSLEGPENGVYVRGKSSSSTITLPDYWTGLVDEDSITVQLTSKGKHQNLYVEDIVDNTVKIGGVEGEFFYFIQAERKDIDKLVVEYGD